MCDDWEKMGVMGVKASFMPTTSLHYGIFHGPKTLKPFGFLFPFIYFEEIRVFITGFFYA